MLILILMSWCPSASAYVRSQTTDGLAISWGQSCIPYFLNERGSDDVDLASLERAVLDSFDAWGANACTGLQLVYGGLTPTDGVGYQTSGANANVVVFREGSSDWIHPRDVIALTTVTYCKRIGGQCTYIGQILDADIEMNGAFVGFSISDNPSLNRFDLQNSLTHEVGHLLGFDHNCSEAAQSCSEQDRLATMYESAPAEEIQKRSLEPDDLDGVCNVYPRMDPLPDCDEEIGEGMIIGDGGVYVEQELETQGCACNAMGTQRPGSDLAFYAFLCSLLCLGRWFLGRRAAG